MTHADRPRSAQLTGHRLGVFEIQGLLGAGGMGEVYSARDTRLGRDVALKVLPEAVAADPERRARLEREAQLLASLNHPNIATLYGIEESPAGCALVMELIDGETLADRLALGGGPGHGLPTNEALTIARQIAEALEAAHAQGIVHRDLKPANVKVRTDGTVKVLDFGLAKAIAPAAETGVTVTAMSVDAHAVAGTPAYMSPEQARGETVGPPSDIWSFGVVLYELLTGVSPFARSTTAETLASVLESRPDYALLPPGLPVMARHVIRRCLENSPKRRWQHIGDVRIGIDAVLSTATEEADPAMGAGARSPSFAPWMAMTVIALLAAAGLIALLYGRRAPGASLIETRIDLPGSASNSLAPHFAISPDAQNIVIVATDPSGQQMLWIRPLHSLITRPLDGTEGGEAPFWSPDSQSVAFVANGRLRKIRVSGGPPSPVADAAYPAPGTWNRDDVILFTPGPDAPLARVPASGGTPSPVTVLNTTAGEAAHAYPSFLPDGRRFLYTAWSTTGAPLGIYVGSLDTAGSTRLLTDVPNAQYASGALFYSQETTLVVREFDASRATFTGNEAAPIAARVFLGRLSLTKTGANAAAFSVSSAGTLVYQASPSRLSRLVWLDSAGREVEVLGQPAEYSDVFLSPDDRLAATSIAAGDGTRDVWVFDTKRRRSSPVAFGPGDEGGAPFLLIAAASRSPRTVRGAWTSIKSPLLERATRRSCSRRAWTNTCWIGPPASCSTSWCPARLSLPISGPSRFLATIDVRAPFSRRQRRRALAHKHRQTESGWRISRTSQDTSRCTSHRILPTPSVSGKSRYRAAQRPDGGLAGLNSTITNLPADNCSLFRSPTAATMYGWATPALSLK